MNQKRRNKSMKEMKKDKRNKKLGTFKQNQA